MAKSIAHVLEELEAQRNAQTGASPGARDRDTLMRAVGPDTGRFLNTLIRATVRCRNSRRAGGGYGPRRVTYEWRGHFTNEGANALHAECFHHEPRQDDWWDRVNQHSVGWVCAWAGEELVGFVNVAWDGGVHAFVLDTMVVARLHRRGVGETLVKVAAEKAAAHGCEWLHVDLVDHLRPFYFDGRIFTAANAGLLRLKKAPEGATLSPRATSGVRRAGA
jgi:hypothetical protein